MVTPDIHLVYEHACTCVLHIMGNQTIDVIFSRNYVIFYSSVTHIDVL